MNEEVQKLREQKLDLEQQNANLKLKIEKREDGKEFMRAYEEDKEHTDEILRAHEEEEPLENRNIKPQIEIVKYVYWKPILVFSIRLTQNAQTKPI